MCFVHRLRHIFIDLLASVCVGFPSRIVKNFHLSKSFSVTFAYGESCSRIFIDFYITIAFNLRLRSGIFYLAIFETNS